MLTSLGLTISNNWGWAETLKNSFTLVELDHLHKKWVVKSINNESDKHTKKNEWQHTQNKRWVTTHSKRISTTAQERLQGE
jgi:cell division protein FtsL